MIERGELDLVYQPVIDLRRRRPVGVEALLRWRNPRLGAVDPSDLIPAAETVGLAGAIGEWVVHHACRQLSLWLRDGRDLWMSVNVSTGQLRSPDFLAGVAAAIELHDVPPERLMVELAEHGVWNGVSTGGDQSLDAVGERLAALRSLGVRTAIDNFGSGRAALTNLRRLPIDAIKIDRSLFAEPAAAGTQPAPPILEVMVEMGRRLGIDVIATRLEQTSHLELAAAAGCRRGQGYALAEPGHAERIEAYLEHHRAPLF